MKSKTEWSMVRVRSDVYKDFRLMMEKEGRKAGATIELLMKKFMEDLKKPTEKVA